MPQITLSVPQDKLPILKDFLQMLGVEQYKIKNIFNRNTSREASNREEEHRKFFSWEYFSNELEFE